MNNSVLCGMIGITDEGQPIVTAGYRCPHFAQQAIPMIGVRECWYCQFADFRKSCDVMLHQSICRCPKNRVNIVGGGKNEYAMQSPALTEQFVSNIKGGVITCVWSKETGFSKAVYLNEGWTAITGYTMEMLNREMDGNPQALVDPEDRTTADLEYRHQTRDNNEYELMYRVTRRDGKTIWVIDRGIVNTLENGDLQNQSIVTEITELKRQEERLKKLAQMDLLTGLYNKMTFITQVSMLLEQQPERSYVMMILDIDDFKKINDSRGHACGDKVLKSVGDCLTRSFRDKDILGRVGGDEFMVMMTDICDKEMAAQRAQELCAAMRSIKISPEETVCITVSIGIALSNGEQHYEAVFKQADIALYQAKNNGKDQSFLCEG